MPKGPKRLRDLNQWAKRMTDIVSGEVEDREPTPAMSVSCGRLGNQIEFWLPKGLNAFLVVVLHAVDSATD
jgi:hypothetical protein